MSSIDFKYLGDQQKLFECLSRYRLTPGLPTIARLDGRAFHTFTRGLDRPFDVRSQRAMVLTAVHLVKSFHAHLAYTQSDEISLIFLPHELTEQGAVSDDDLMFGGSIQKLCSLFAASCSAKFNQLICGVDTAFPPGYVDLPPEYVNRVPTFDCRFYQVPIEKLVGDYLIWRELDALRNSLNMLASFHYSPKELHKMSSKERRDMLYSKGVDWSTYPDGFRRGTYLRRVVEQRLLTNDELNAIPEKHRPPPNQLVTRSRIAESGTDFGVPLLTRIENLTDFLFHGAPVEFKTRPDQDSKTDEMQTLNVELAGEANAI